eukprot:CAMPEP_0204513586 /NCGR_PEP_ID=MMETSP0661-20131031/1586_1 /ASSEMBLY_ACC=CAM_ASM_000606 /TAXON_ID=109239 /ORGANISM="Alexandrium margalefi, Strain AMGDE01CS-322" /LENGTH=263 /DNA_ID=CAMNT_0051518767 /DNA_START=54 /DNA_END=845 /DNA_ORIENTATION=+
MAAALLAAVTAAALVSAVASKPAEQVLAAHDVCSDGGAGCALNALQQQRWEVDGSGTAEQKVLAPAPVPMAPAPAPEPGAFLFDAMARGGIKEMHLAGPRAEYARLSLAEAEARANGTGRVSCSTFTGGTCFSNGCDASRGSTECTAFQCLCRSGFCVQNGVCTFDWRSAMSSWGGGGSLGASSGGWGGWGGAAPAPPPPANNAWSTAWQQPQSGGGSRFTGGSCVTSNCDASRGATTCGMSTGYQCMCKESFHAVNGMCMWR